MAPACLWHRYLLQLQLPHARSCIQDWVCAVTSHLSSSARSAEQHALQVTLKNHRACMFTAIHEQGVHVTTQRQHATAHIRYRASNGLLAPGLRDSIEGYGKAESKRTIASHSLLGAWDLKLTNACCGGAGPKADMALCWSAELAGAAAGPGPGADAGADVAACSRLLAPCRVARASAKDSCKPCIMAARRSLGICCWSCCVYMRRTLSPAARILTMKPAPIFMPFTAYTRSINAECIMLKVCISTACL